MFGKSKDPHHRVKAPRSEQLKLRDWLGILCIGVGLMAFEVTLHTMMRVQHPAGMGAVLIGTGLFGFAIGAVIIAGSTRLRKVRSRKIVPWCALWAGLTMVSAYGAAAFVPLDFTAAFRNPIVQFADFCVVLIAMVLPFFFGGMAIASMLERSPRRVGGLWGFCLIGAGAGAAGAILVAPIVGGAIVVWAGAAVLTLSAALFAMGYSTGVMAMSLLLTAAVAAGGYFLAPTIDLPTHTAKSTYLQDRVAGQMERDLRRWTGMSRLDVSLDKEQQRGLIWHNAGADSWPIIENSGKFDAPPAFVSNSSGTLPFVIDQRESALIVSPGGGVPILWALAEHVPRIVLVQPDPVFAALVTDDLDEYLGGLFTRPEIEIVQEDVRGYLRRVDDRFDVIQVDEPSPTHLPLLGDVATAEANVLTVESMQEMIEHLTENGVLMITGYNGPKLLSLALTTHQRLGLDPTEHLYMENSKNTPGPHMVLVKRSPFSDTDLDRIASWLRRTDIAVIYAPPALASILPATYVPSQRDEKLEKVAADMVELDADGLASYAAGLHYSSDAPTDDRPFSRHITRFGRRLRDAPNLPAPLEMMSKSRRSFGPMPLADTPPITLLVGALILAPLVVIVPIRRIGRTGPAHARRGLSLIYFFTIGLGFVAVEVTLLQRVVMLIGQPALATAIGMGALLASAGVGSLILSPILVDRPKLAALCFAVVMVLITAGATQFARAFDYVAPLDLMHRCLVTGGGVAVFGLFLGAALPAGLRYAHRQEKRVVSWGWALHAYAGVIGLALLQIALPMIGYTAVMMLAAAAYFVGGVALLMMEARLSDALAAQPEPSEEKIPVAA